MTIRRWLERLGAVGDGNLFAYMVPYVLRDLMIRGACGVIAAPIPKARSTGRQHLSVLFSGVQLPQQQPCVAVVQGQEDVASDADESRIELPAGLPNFQKACC